MNGGSPPPPSSWPRSPHSTSADFDEGRFLPGTLMAQRYRIVGRLGKGGMGEVYRATDLRLAQTVALKFLPETAVRDPALLARFYNEVRVARQITHPNVCRVYDIGEVEGQPFISMQFVDGENLASLLLRIGRLPADKAVEIARKLCAGLAAAHSQGVLHRDLKPANIMIDGRGQVLITDFGLAGLAEEIHGHEIRSGTPAYMSPEQLAGTEVTLKSDIYALGLVMVEMFTGKTAYQADTLAELIRVRQESRPLEISGVVRDLDPAIERIITRCLDPDPAKRPTSALAVSAALPGGDPLAAALAAGETPSPEMVAASGAQEAYVRPLVAACCFAAILIALGTVTWFNPWLMIPGTVALDMPPEALAVEAHRTLNRLGYSAAPVDRAWGFLYDTSYIDYVGEESKKHAIPWPSVANNRPSPLLFWYRESPRPFETENLSEIGAVTTQSPPLNVTGMTRISIDPQGRLMSFSAVPPEREVSPAPAKTPDPAPLFTAAGLSLSAFHATEPQWTPLVATDYRAAWTGSFPEHPDLPVRVEAAWWRAKPVYFAILGPWSKAERDAQRPGGSFDRYGWLSFAIVLMAAGALLAWRNLRLGRGDRQGAIRLAAFGFALRTAGWLLGTHYTASGWEIVLLIRAIGDSLWLGFQLWLAYIALEPAVRRRWPRILVTWTRVLSGNWRDTLVARDVLIGLGLGLFYNLAFASSSVYTIAHGRPPQQSTYLPNLLGFRHIAGGLLDHIVAGFGGTLTFFFMFFLILLLVRKEWIAGILFAVVFAISRTIGSDFPVMSLVLFGTIYGSSVFTLLRFGMLPVVVAIFVTDLIVAFIFTTNFASWYGTSSLLAFAFVAGLASWAFVRVIGGVRVLSNALEQ